MLGWISSKLTSTLRRTRVGDSVSTVLFTTTFVLLRARHDGRAEGSRCDAVVGTGRFELPISCSQSRRLTKLGHVPRMPARQAYGARRASIPAPCDAATARNDRPVESHGRRARVRAARVARYRGGDRFDHAGVAQWQSPSLPSWPCRFDPGHPLSHEGSDVCRALRSFRGSLGSGGVHGSEGRARRTRSPAH